MPNDLPNDEAMLIETKLWQRYFHKAVRSRGAGVGIVFATPSGGLMFYSFSLHETCSNHMAEHVLIISLNWPLKCILTS